MKRYRSIYALLFIALSLILFALNPLVYAQNRSNDIHRVDFQNFTYRPGCAEGKAIRARNGHYNYERGYDRLDFAVENVSYGDLTGDGRDEAVITTWCNTGGTGMFTEGHIYTMRGGRAVEITRLEIGDRAFGGIVSATVENGLLVVERYAPVEDGMGACCPQYIEMTRSRLNGRRLVQVGKTQRREVETENQD